VEKLSYLHTLSPFSPVISLQPKSTLYGEGLLAGQVHLVDTRGNRKLFGGDGRNMGSEHSCPDIRFGTADQKRVVYNCANRDEDQGFDRDFHLYEVEWTPGRFRLKLGKN